MQYYRTLLVSTLQSADWKYGHQFSVEDNFR